MSFKEAALKAEAIRKQNVQRHHTAAAVSKLRFEIRNHTANRNMQMELGRLQEASLRHSGLDVPAIKRMTDLKTMIVLNEHRNGHSRWQNRWSA